MGASEVQQIELKEHELQEYAKISSFTHSELNNLFKYYTHFSASITDDGVIDYGEFCDALSMPDSLVTQRVFMLFDTNRDGVINFREFVIGLTYYLYETTEQQIRFSFKLFDINGTGYCTKQDLKDVLKSYMGVMCTLGLMKDKAAGEVLAEQMVEETFAGLKSAAPGKLSYDEYKKMHLHKLFATRWLALDMEKLNTGVKLLAEKVAKRK